MDAGCNVFAAPLTSPWTDVLGVIGCFFGGLLCFFMGSMMGTGGAGAGLDGVGSFAKVGGA